jgi:hypothetical protein
VFQVVPTSCRQGRFQPLRPFLVGLGEPPHLIGSQAKVTEHRTERLAAVDGVEELLPHLGGEPLLRPGPSAGSLVVGMRPGAEGAVAPSVPTRIRPMRRLLHSREGSEITARRAVPPFRARRARPRGLRRGRTMQPSCNRQVQRGSRGNHATVGIRRHRVQPAQGSTAVIDPADSLLAIHTRAGRACRCRKARTSRLRTN